MKPKLYQYAACPFCNKVRTILKYKGVDFETIEVHPMNKKEIAFSTNYRAVPIYIDSKGLQVNDSTPIMKWIDTEYPLRKVFAVDASEKTREDYWLEWSDKFVKGVPAAIYDTFPNALKSFNYITKIAKFNALEKQFLKVFGAFVMSLVAKKIKKREQIDDPAEFLKTKAQEWIQGLEGRSFMGGAQPNGADLAVYGIFQSITDLEAGDLMRTNTQFSAWLDRVRESIDASEMLSAQI